MSTKTKREYPFFSAVLDLIAIHSKKVSLAAAVITSAVISLYYGHAPHQFLFAGSDVIISMLIGDLGAALCFYALIHIVDFCRQISIDSGLENLSLRKSVSALLILYFAELFRPEDGVVQTFIEYGVNPNFAWSYFGAGIAILSALLIYTYVDDKIKEATGG
ncbi:hypothetical protein F9K94_21345 [Brucella tritici]|uniref:Uncharacterized protein n=1 Tax=Brucella tritici TaxID=94626 RepID=A0A7V7VQU9_9HYPH|nr:hypothetical protein [Brucella tritici]KAB2655105.1 hypothetical protein F9K94_21345 [Brucella tritici]